MKQKYTLESFAERIAAEAVVLHKTESLFHIDVKSPIIAEAVRACNNYDKLLAALERLTRIAGVTKLAQQRPDVFEQAHAALANAEAEK